MLNFFLFIILTSIGYLSGSICSAIIICKIFSLPDPSQEGSNNPGATNVLRLAGKKYASMVLVGDILKGFLPLLLGHLLGANDFILGVICLAAVLGHMYPIFFKFEGGKGVATALGALLGFHFIMGIVLIAIWMLIANFSRYSSLASIVTLTITPFVAIYSSQNVTVFPPLFLMSALIIYKHRENISRLLAGNEHKISLKHHQLSDITESILKERIQEEKAHPKEDHEK